MNEYIYSGYLHDPFTDYMIIDREKNPKSESFTQMADIINHY